jgi:hypothetical protein
MEQNHNEPQPPVATPRPCSTPHSAPVEWLETVTAELLPPPKPDLEAIAEAEAAAAAEAEERKLDEIVAQIRSNPHALARVAESLAPEDARRDGWTPFARRLFLEALSETGRVGLACEHTGLTRQSAYALRARDPLFSASWDAACEIARAPLADALYEKALDGVTDTITKDGKVVATRHRFDARLSIAVLNRLDKRCDRAEERGSRHLALVARWDEWMSLVGKGAEAEAAALLEPANHCQTCQLPEGDDPISLEHEPEEIDLSDRFWEDGNGDGKTWMTDLPPPSNFTGYEGCDYGDPDEKYERECTPEEAEILEGDATRAKAAERAEEEELRDSWLALLKADLASPPRHSGLEPQPACRSHGGDEARRQRDEGEEEIRQVPDRVRDDGPPGAVRTDRPRDDGHEATAAAPFNPASSPRPPSQAAADGP